MKYVLSSFEAAKTFFPLYVILGTQCISPGNISYLYCMLFWQFYNLLAIIHHCFLQRSFYQNFIFSEIEASPWIGNLSFAKQTSNALCIREVLVLVAQWLHTLTLFTWWILCHAPIEEPRWVAIGPHRAYVMPPDFLPVGFACVRQNETPICIHIICMLHVLTYIHRMNALWHDIKCIEFSL